MLSRRDWIRRSTLLSAAFTTPGLFAEELARTARMTEGPFYPDTLPLDTDNDLILLNDSLTPSVGEITHLTGRVLTTSGSPIRNAFVEIWQADANGAYIHSGTNRADERDSHFQGYGRFLTGVRGEYYFRTIKPVAYDRRAPHIHLAVSKNGKRLLTTQALIDGHELNAQDGPLRQISDKGARQTVMTDFRPIEGSKLGELEASFDMIVGITAEELEDGSLSPGGLGPREWGRRRRG